MAYTPKVWENDETEVDETNMNHIEQGIKDNDDKLQGLTSMGSIVVDSIRSKNIFNENWALGSINVSDGSINPDNASTSIVSANLIPVKPNTTYIISFSGGNYTIDRIAYFNSSGTFISRSDSLGVTTFTTDANTYFIRFNIWLSGITPSAVGNTQLEVGTTATSYLPYQELNIDYKKGTWTPVMQNATVNYTIQSGEYIKIGNLVYISFRLRGKITSIPQYPYAFISGVPFKPSNVPGCGSLYEHANCFDNNSTPRLMRIGFDGTYPNGFVAIQNGGVGGMGISWWVSSNNTFYLSGSGFYIVN